jgi:protein-tyrosine-phosphatase
MFGDRAHFESAGLYPHPASDARLAIRTLKEQFDIDASAHVPSDAHYVSLSSYDWVVALESDVASELDIPSTVKFESWAVDDPYGRPEEYVSCGRVIEGKLMEFGRRIDIAPAESSADRIEGTTEPSAE